MLLARDAVNCMKDTIQKPERIGILAVELYVPHSFVRQSALGNLNFSLIILD